MGRNPQKYCLDCGKRINSYGNGEQRCRSCAMKITILKWKSQGKRIGHWKGGRRKLGNYIALYKPNYPKANKKGYVLEHIWVWETEHQQVLPNGWVIHHLNGIKTDNRLCNLVGLSTQKHAEVLMAKAKRIQELEASLKSQGQLI